MTGTRHLRYEARSWVYGILAGVGYRELKWAITSFAIVQVLSWNILVNSGALPSEQPCLPFGDLATSDLLDEIGLLAT